jgi:hypothetical protein
MPQIERSLYLDEIEELYEEIDKLRDDVDVKHPWVFYALTLGSFICLTLAIVLFHHKLAIFFSLLLFAIFAVSSFSLYRSRKDDSTYAQESINQIKSILKENQISVDRYQFKRGFLLKAEMYNYLLELDEHRVICIQHHINFGKDFYAHLSLEYYPDRHPIKNSIGRYFPEYGNLELLKPLYTDHNEVIDLLSLEHKKIIYKPLEEVLKDCKATIALVEKNQKANTNNRKDENRENGLEEVDKLFLTINKLKETPK